MSVIDTLPIVREGVWLYANEIPVTVRILSSPETFGSGDEEYDDEVAENQPIPCFFLAYEMAGSPGKFCNVTVNLMSLGEAIAYVDERFPGIRWLTADSGSNEV
jgi:hypothetical protein